MPVTQPVTISKLIEALLDTRSPFSPRYLNRLSDLDGGDIAEFAGAWPRVTVQRRQALLEDLEEIHLADDLQNFEAVARIALNDEDPGVRTRAISILREYELVDLLPRFIDMSEHDPDVSVRAGATAALGVYIYLGEIEVISHSKLMRAEECLLKRISSKDEKLVLCRALEALGFSSRQEVFGLIDQAYTSGDVEWLISALFAMGRSANSHWNPMVLEVLNHTQPGVRAEAASAAGELEIKKAKPILLELLEDPDIDVRLAAIWALSQVGGSGVREALENYLESIDDSEEADQIDNALENLEFTEELRDINLLEISEDGDDSYDPSEDEYEEDIDDLISEDGKD